MLSYDHNHNDSSEVAIFLRVHQSTISRLLRLGKFRRLNLGATGASEGNLSKNG